MSLTFARPDVADLVFHVYARILHPELIEPFASETIVRDGYQACVSICEDGHVVSFQVRDAVISEVTASRYHPLPQRKRLLEHRLRGHRDGELECENGVHYQMSYQVERLHPDVFQKMHEELRADCSRTRLSHRFPASNRMAPGPLSLVSTEATPDSLLVHAFHTFPDNCAIVKTQSLFEL
jgi:hypothetical protein